MKNLIIFGCLLSITRLVAQQTTIGDYPCKTVNFTAVTLQDNFWLPRMEINRQSTIPHSFAKCEETGRVKNFQMAAQHSGKFCTTYPFDDTDIFKTLEGAAYSLSIHPDPALDRYCDSMIAIVAKDIVQSFQTTIIGQVI